MTLVVCIDEKRGMCFNQRRQSRDRLLIEDLAKETKGGLFGKKLLIQKYSEPLFHASGIRTVIADDPIAEARGDDFCFVETLPLSGAAEKADTVILYHWNRHYPADGWFDLDLSGYRLTKSYDFVGSSHEKITKEIYKK